MAIPVHLNRSSVLIQSGQAGFVSCWYTEGMIILALLGILAAIAIPAYNNYTIREKMQVVATAGDQATQLLDAYILQHGRWPLDPSAADISISSPLIAGIELHPSSGQMVITTAFHPLEKQALVFVRDDKPPSFAWRCGSKGAAEKYLPSRCRQ